ncbi:hypothetical protein B0T22DRAFT_255561 [Podospora appendiculata]|uniref:Uncharacterized protein n=1 Tax=Podospora appendiculata TaxID=314037 RepID=A0AAE0X2K9_9PEZI|nr:hypothetical protein B0T22DRAFT_255561 [Podospora appendiculata]
MASSFNPEEVFSFLRDHGRPEEPYNATQAYAYAYSAADAYGNSAPRWADEYDTGSLDTPMMDMDQGSLSNYTTTTTTTTTNTNTTTTTAPLRRSRPLRTSTMRAPSIFSSTSRSHPHPRGSSASSVATSSVPPRNPPQPLYFAAQHPPPSLAAAAPAPNAHLWCEFSALQNCPVTFRLDDTAAWIQHHARHHLRDTFPATLTCWFCDHVPFTAAHQADRRANFETRMEHIRAHIFGDYLGVDHMRPDFNVIEHMGRRRLIDQATYDLAMSYDELPAPLRLPGAGAEWAAAAAAPAVQAGPERGMQYDLEREERRRRRRERDGGGRRGW